MRKVKSIEALIREYLAVRQVLLDERVDIQRKLQILEKTLGETSLPLRRSVPPPVRETREERAHPPGPAATPLDPPHSEISPARPQPEAVLSAHQILESGAAGTLSVNSAVHPSASQSEHAMVVQSTSSNASLTEPSKEDIVPDLDPIELTRAVNKLIDDYPEELPSFRRAGIPTVTQRHLLEVKALVPNLQEIDAEMARDSLMSLRLGESVLRHEEIKDFILRHAIQTVGSLVEAIPNLEELKRNDQMLLLARLFRRLQLLSEVSPQPGLEV